MGSLYYELLSNTRYVSCIANTCITNTTFLLRIHGATTASAVLSQLRPLAKNQEILAGGDLMGSEPLNAAGGNHSQHCPLHCPCEPVS